VIAFGTYCRCHQSVFSQLRCLESHSARLKTSRPSRPIRHQYPRASLPSPENLLWSHLPLVWFLDPSRYSSIDFLPIMRISSDSPSSSVQATHQMDGPPQWAPHTTYNPGNAVWCAGTFWRCETSHTSGQGLSGAVRYFFCS